RALRRRAVDRDDAPLADRALHHDAMRDMVDALLGGVARPAGDLEHGVLAVDGLADDGRHAQAPLETVASARTSARCASSILKAFCASGRAPASARAAAA